MGVRQVYRRKRRVLRCRRRYGAGHCPHKERHSRDVLAPREDELEATPPEPVTELGRTLPEPASAAHDVDWFKPAF